MTTPEPYKPKEGKAVLRLPNCIRMWESILFHDAALLSPEMRLNIESTITHLKDLEIRQKKEG